MRLLARSLILAALAACSSSPPAGITTGTAGTTGASTGGSSSGQTGRTSSTAGASGSTSSTSGSTTGAIAGLGTPCSPTNQPDTCQQTYGLACLESPNYFGDIEDGGEGGTCALPGELQGCLTSVGCADPSLSCTVITGTAESACVRGCATSAGCPVPYTTCQGLGGPQGAPICFYNFCVAPAPLAQPGSYYGPCNASQAGQGTCVPIENLQLGVVGLCLEAGAGQDGGACGTFRDAGTCGVGLACDQLLFGPGGGICREICAFTGDAGPTCPGTQACSNASSLGVPSAIDWGVCMNPCGLGHACPQGEQCYAPGGAAGLCFP